jgi:hypothetical protein
MTQAELRSLVEAIVKGARRPVVDVSFAEFVTLYDLLLKRVDQAHSDVTIVLADSSGWATFPNLSPQILAIVEPHPLRRSDVRLASPGRVRIVGGDRRGFASFLLADLRQRWLWLLALALVILGSSLVADLADLAATLGQLFALAATLFFAVFVLFGVGEVVRTAALQNKTFETGQLQDFLDADRYLVRLALSGFALAVLTVLVAAIEPGLVRALDGRVADPWPSIVPSGVVALPLWMTAASVSLCLHATAGYLLDRGAGALVIGLGQSALEQPALPQAHPEHARSDPLESSPVVADDGGRRDQAPNA